MQVDTGELISGSSTIVSMDVLSAKDGAKVRLKLEDSTGDSDNGNTKYVELDAITESNGDLAWETLTWNFAETLDPSHNYDRAAVFFDFGETGDDNVYYFDNVNFEGFIA